MRIAHHCFACGSDLTSILARIDDRLGLPLVTCPNCRRTHVRRPPMAQRRWRRIRRGALAALLLAFQVGFLAGATALVIFGAGLLDATARDLIAGREPNLTALLSSLGLDLAPAATLALPLAMFAVAGLWHGMSFGHFGALDSVAGFALWVVLVVLLAAMIELRVVGPDHVSEILRSLGDLAMGLLEGGLVFVGAVLLGRRAAMSRLAWRRNRYRLALASRRRRNMESHRP